MGRRIHVPRRAAVSAGMALTLAALLAACEPLSLTALGVGGSAAVNHTVSSSPNRTFTAPFVKVRAASLSALDRMGIKTNRTTKVHNGEIISATAGKRHIEVELEAITSSATRIKVTAHQGGLFYDGATANEIIVQTGKDLGI